MSAAEERKGCFWLGNGGHQKVLWIGEDGDIYLTSKMSGMLIAAWIFSTGIEEKGLGPVADLLGWGLCVQVPVRSGALEHLEVREVGGGGGLERL